MQAKVISTEGMNMLLQYTDDNGVPQRVYLPMRKGAVAGGSIDVDEPQRGMPYGDVIISKNITIKAEDLQRRLRELGIWTREDLARRPQLYVEAVAGVARLSLSEVLGKETK